MNGFLDDLSVGLVLLAGFGYAAYSLGPKSLRGRIGVSLAAVMRRLPRFLGLRGVAGRLAAMADAGTRGACGGCDNCGSESPPAAAPPGPAPEVRIPVAKIGTRSRRPLP